MPVLIESPKTTEERTPNKLILCFDGTGNQFSGNTADTNVVKLLNKLDRNHPHQYHYYQTGIGTYSVDEKSFHQTLYRKIATQVSQTLDTGLAFTFDAHVMAGYRFLMRYYESGDKIYMFGFSRGAYTAKFLARMIQRVGLLCRGNEEMVPFAFRLYAEYLASAKIMKKKDKKPAAKHRCGEEQPLLGEDGQRMNYDDASDDEGDDKMSKDDTMFLGSGAPDGEFSDEFKAAINKIRAFKRTFCRRNQQGKQDRDVKVFFLGIWDCVNSVAMLEQTAQAPVPVVGTARYVRHAVSVDERRIKFKPALLAQDIKEIKRINEDTTNGIEIKDDIKEVWFAGNHGDVGGGWPAVPRDKQDNYQKMTWWQKLKHWFTTDKTTEASESVCNDHFQLSDVSLAWMIREIELVGELEESTAVQWRKKQVTVFKKRFQLNNHQAVNGFIHDPLKFGYGTAFFKVLFWWLLELSPFITRYELENDIWVPKSGFWNLGARRDIPKDAVIHESLKDRLLNDDTYWPINNHGGKERPCLKRRDKEIQYYPEGERKHLKEGRVDPLHQTYTLSEPVPAVNGA